MLDLGRQAREQLYEDPQVLLDMIQEEVMRQQKIFDQVFEELISELRNHDVHFIREDELDQKQVKFVKAYFKETVRPLLVPLMLNEKSKPELTDKASYLAVKLSNPARPKDTQYALIEIPAASVGRFFLLPKGVGCEYLMFLDDVIRLGLEQVFKMFDYTKIEAYALKLTRDAELDIDEDVDESVIEKLVKGLSARKKAQPVRFIYDSSMPQDLLDFLMRKLKITHSNDMVPSGRYHNLRDFMNFPSLGKKALNYDRWKPSRHGDLNNQRSLLDIIAKKDILLNYPYQSFSHTIDILREAAIDPKVQSIKINIYRIARESKVINALINASKNGKDVTVIVELRARFDEESNIYWSKQLKENGVKVIFGVEGLKVHSKLILITCKQRNKLFYISHVGTGNFHEGTANLYTDVSLWTSNPQIGRELDKLFDFFKNNYKRATFRELLVSPFNMRRKIHALIDNEIRNVKSGKPGYILIKLNNLVDDEIVRRLYKASQAGVKIKLIIRGICSLVPGVPGLSEHIEVISILDRFLEHSRILVFANGGDEKYFISSADWMVRNLDRRVEVGIPVHCPKLQLELRTILELHLSDNCKARIIDEHQGNSYRTSYGKSVRSQREIYNFYKGVSTSKLLKD
jgi:polyphosphate kinase